MISTFIVVLRTGGFATQSIKFEMFSIIPSSLFQIGYYCVKSKFSTQLLTRQSSTIAILGVIIVVYGPLVTDPAPYEDVYSETFPHPVRGCHARDERGDHREVDAVHGSECGSQSVEHVLNGSCEELYGGTAHEEDDL